MHYRKCVNHSVLGQKQKYIFTSPLTNVKQCYTFV